MLLPALVFAGAPYPSSLAGVSNPLLDTALEHTWSGIKARNIAPYGDGLVHRPKSETPGDAVSESSSYGMIAALYDNDQTTFNSIWDATEKDLWSSTGGFYNWRWDNGAIPVGGKGMATDADEDICMTLLFADSLVKKGVWKAHTSPLNVDYKTRAKAMLSTLWSQAVTANYNLSPGAAWGGDAFVDPGYLAPANYRIFAKADTAHNWMAVVDQAYKVIQANPGYALGLLPDWMVPNGTWYSGSLGYNPFDQGHDMYKDGIRVLWRLGLDWTWNGEPRAKAFLDTAMNFLGANPALANFYQMDGNLVSPDSIWSLSGGAGCTRPRQEHSHLTIGTWACASMASSNPAIPAAWATELLAHRDSPTSDYWGWAVDPNATDAIHAEDTAHNEMYFDQFLAWFGAAVLEGRFSNIWEDLADPMPGVPQAWTTQPQVSARQLDFQTMRLSAGARLEKPAAWRITITQRTSGQTWSTSGSSDSLSAVWGGQASDGAPFAQGACDVVFSAHGLSDVSTAVWVAHQKDIRSPDGKWLIVDDFAAPTLSPNLGAWSSFDNSSAGGDAKISNFGVSGAGADRSLQFDYNLGTPNLGYNYCGVGWDANGWTGLQYVTRVTYRLKASHSIILDDYVLESDITDQDYFHVLDTVGTSWKTYTHSIASFNASRINLRSGSPNMSTATGFHWHIQEDKQVNGLSSGHFQIDSFHLGQVTAQMYTPPAAFVAMPPEVAIKGVAAENTSVVAIPQGLRVTVPRASRAVVRDLTGRVLASSDLPVGTSNLQLSGHGLAIVQLTAPGFSDSRSVALCNR
jgi:endo-1,4-beta-D-glucanase Y